MLRQRKRGGIQWDVFLIIRSTILVLTYGYKVNGVICIKVKAFIYICTYIGISSECSVKLLTKHPIKESEITPLHSITFENLYNRKHFMMLTTDIDIHHSV